MKRQSAQCPPVIELDSSSISELDYGSRKSVDLILHAANDPVSIHSEVSMKSCAVSEVHELMLAATLDSCDHLLAQSSRCCVRKLSENGGMKCLCSRYR